MVEAVAEGWDGYLASFHAQRPGITEEILDAASAGDGDDPYDWLAEALPDGVIVDVACGSGPLADRITGSWVGLDRSLAELRRAAVHGSPGRVVLADAASTPLRTGSANAVACSMALMLFEDPGTVVAELARLLPAGGRLVALLPAMGPLTVRDRARYVRLLATLRLRQVPFRHSDVLHDPGSLLSAAGLRVENVQQGRFAYPITTPEDGLLWLRSLYLPETGDRRWQAARRVVQRWIGSSIGLPLQRLVATKTR